MVHCWNRW